MSALDWDHNAFYHGALLRRLPPHCRKVADIGCGAGTLAAKLAERADRVDAIDRSPEILEVARTVVPANVSCVLSDVLEQPLPENEYDAIVSMTTLHHLPLDRALPMLAAALRPGGVLVAAALPRTELPRELSVELLAALGHRAFGLAFALRRALGRNGFGYEPTHGVMPKFMDPADTTRAVRRRAAALLPGAQVRRLVFWRYLLVWRKPA
ncbi:class I SAM-dependent methyltransferase [Nocardia terpenica]|uniref:Methyltransferase n=1 Tax=Nocardia terpenica TaxID=455432 RepID=A0A164MT52_9NOCA|nr:class I SAM-dependent methyltransferase [Nocardia terpenica]KZM73639.1 methyltransferase [Nocardia terpenica]NQE87135.1 class I SAM-dependent methyltransferase [Nocardia terpenica]